MQIGASRRSPSSEEPRTAADAAVAAWEEIGTRLAPVLGRRGVAALYRRSVHLTLARYPWLAPAYEAPTQVADLAALHAALEAQDAPVAEAASAELLANFRALLITLIGDTLTARLLAPPPPGSPDADPAKEPPP
ncbi:hypothetical protein [Ramlibacter sp. AN1133]|uniref:hypothetical protein n=1 Tax=Ramlibacter sp. AN1133 TaxID=3133429 RepID=UPI0030C211B3